MNDRLCEMQKAYIEMRQEWFSVVHLGEKSTLTTKDLQDIDEAQRHPVKDRLQMTIPEIYQYWQLNIKDK